MIAKKMKTALSGSSAIRAMFVEGKQLAKEVGEDQVFDFSLGNPASPAPESVKTAIKHIVDQMDPLLLHGYMDNSGYPEVRTAIADNLNRRFSTTFTHTDLVMTVGAAGGLNILFKTLLDPGDEVIVFAPFFGEYSNYANNYDAKLVAVLPAIPSFEPDLKAFEQSITPKTKVVIVNTPNNPTGVVYSSEILKKIGEQLKAKQEEYQTHIYLISDEPYRELVYDGLKEDFLTKYYQNTIVAYSFSKSLSLPGERIGYIAVPKDCTDSNLIVEGLTVANRILGFVNAPSLIQKAVAACIEETTDLDFYDQNRIVLYEGLSKLGFSCVKPEGAFYLWMKSPIESEDEFVKVAKKYHILMVKGSAFGCPGYVRLAYCIPHDKVVRSLQAFEQLSKEYFGE